jgi:Beta-ketoacyl synthase, N-terminal domain
VSPPSTLPCGTDPAGLTDPGLTDPGLTVLARAHWPAAPGDVLPPIPGFISSSFSPLVAELAERCLRAYFGTRPADPARGERTAVLLASVSGDIGTAAAVAEAVDAGRRVPPLLFFQSNPNAVAGHLAARWELAGPVVCISPATAALADALDAAALLVEDGDADAVLVIAAEQSRAGPQRDHGMALLIGPASWPSAARPAQPDDSPAGG